MLLTEEDRAEREFEQVMYMNKIAVMIDHPPDTLATDLSVAPPADPRLSE